MSALAPRRGFTLIELLIAISIFALIAVIAHAGLNSIVQSRERIKAREVQTKALQMAMSIMQSDLTQIVNRRARDEFGDTQPALITGGPAADALISFTRTGRPNPGDVPRSALSRISYRLNEQRLMRVLWVRPDRAPGDEGDTAELLDGVADIHFRFLDDKKQWHDDWPPLTAAANFNKIPVAIEVRLTHDSWGELRRLFALAQ